MISGANSVPTWLPSGRRLYARRSMDGPAYVDFGTDHPAILIDLGEGGLGFQSVVPVNLDHVFHLKLKVSRVSIESYAELTWLNESGKCGGLRFVELSVDALAQIREWIGVAADREAGPRVHPEETGGSAGSAQEGVTKEAKGSPSFRFYSLYDKMYRADVLESRAAATQESQAPSVLQNQSRASESVAGSDAPSHSLQAFADAENAQAAGVSPEISYEPAAEEASGDQVPADLDALSILRFAHDRAEIPVRDSTPPLVASASPERAVRMPASDSNNALAVLKSKAIPARVKPESQFPAASGQDPGSFIRQSQKSAHTSPQLENLPGLQERKWKWRTTPASGVLTIGIGAAAGALLMLALMAVVPSLRTHLQATANPKSSGSNLPDAQVFQVEVADLSNRRWILKSGGEAASPFSNLPPQTGTHAAAAPGSRSESANASRSEDNATPDKPQVKLPTPGELGLPRPHEPRAAAVPAQVVAPSIFDGITPPIGSVSEQLTAIGPDATGPEIVKPQNPASPPKSALQAAVLVQRVEPVYPKIAVASRVMGQVRLSVTIGRDGVPTNVKVLSGDRMLADAARTAVSQWRYRPATLGGEPIETQTIVSIDFGQY